MLSRLTRLRRSRSAFRRNHSSSGLPEALPDSSFCNAPKGSFKHLVWQLKLQTLRRQSAGNMHTSNGAHLPRRPSQPYRRHQPPSRENSSEEQNTVEGLKEKEKMFKFVANVSYFILASTVVVVVALLILTFPNPSQWRPFDITGDEEVEEPVSAESEMRRNLGGWRQANSHTEKLLNSSICNIDKRSSHELSAEEFERTYRHRRPVIVSFPHGASDWTDPEQWSRQDLMDKYGAWEIASGRSDEIVRNGGSGNEISSFAEYVDWIMDDHNESDEPMYVFDRLFYKESSLPSTIHVPPYFEIKDELDDSIFFVGASMSGVSFHKHADAWNGVVFGRKRWFLYPPQTTPPGGVWPGFSSLDWFTKVYPHLEEEKKPLECIQGPGEILYIPESFYHGTLNIGDTIAVGIQKKEATTELEKLFYEAKESENIDQRLPTEIKLRLLKKNVSFFQRLQTLMPNNAEVLNRLGFAIFSADPDNAESAIKITLQALDIDPYFLVAILNTATYYQHLGQNEIAEEYFQRAEEINPNSWQVYAQYGDFLANLGRSEEAVKVYQVGTRSQPRMLPFWVRLSEQQEKSGNLEAAEESRQQVMKIQRGEL